MNKSIDDPKCWEEDGLTFTEVIRQEYAGNNCILRGGFVSGDNKPEVDTVFLRLEKDNSTPLLILLRPDEMQAIAWIATGTLWSYIMGKSQ